MKETDKCKTCPGKELEVCDRCSLRKYLEEREDEEKPPSKQTLSHKGASYECRLPDGDSRTICSLLTRSRQVGAGAALAACLRLGKQYT